MLFDFYNHSRRFYYYHLHLRGNTGAWRDEIILGDHPVSKRKGLKPPNLGLSKPESCLDYYFFVTTSKNQEVEGVTSDWSQSTPRVVPQLWTIRGCKRWVVRFFSLVGLGYTDTTIHPLGSLPCRRKEHGVLHFKYTKIFSVMN